MATAQTAARGHARTLSQTHITLPGSPTLSNPDMILPDYIPSRMHDLDDRAQSPLTAWQNSQGGANNGVAPYNSQHQTFQGFPPGPVMPITPIIYGNGTMLSDIGEVTEVESTPGKRTPVKRRTIATASTPTPMTGRDSKASSTGLSNATSDAALRSSPTMGNGDAPQRVKKRTKETAAANRDRRLSNGSTSTITTVGPTDAFADFDDSISIGDSLFQGDDEESMASSYVDDASPTRAEHDVPTNPNVARNRIVPGTTQHYSAAALSRKAEHILANAKKRLTTMEDNLTRARSSLGANSSSPSPSPMASDGSMTFPPLARNSMGPLATQSDSNARSSPGHARQVSENSLRIGLPIKVYPHPQRSTSANSTNGGYRQPLAPATSIEQLGNQQPVRQSFEGPIALKLTAKQNDKKRLSEIEEPLDKRASYNSSTYGEAPETQPGSRPTSVAQVRDLKDQMMDLKGKISNLRQQARADSLRRRSMQSLRTPSPFTHSQVDQWYAKPEMRPVSGSATDEVKAPQGPVKGGAAIDKVQEESSGSTETQSARPSTVADTEDSTFQDPPDPDEALNSLRPPAHYFNENVRNLATAQAGPETLDDDLRTEDGDSQERDAADNMSEADTVSESGNSTYHDTLQQQVSHEDREDAFDYEHFFLHSAMGSMSQRRLRRGDRDSFSSEDSVETTRGPTVINGVNTTLKRRGSRDSTSTEDTFATATEGHLSRRSSAPNIGIRSPRPEDVPDAPSRNEYFDAPSTITQANGYSIIRPTSIMSTTSDPRQSFAAKRPWSANNARALHRPSISSFESIGTTRSFPLVNPVRSRKAASTGVITPGEGSPDQDLKSIANVLLKSTISAASGHRDSVISLRKNKDRDSSLGSSARSSLASVVRKDGEVGSNRDSGGAQDTANTIQTLSKEDQFMVERMVAALGKSVLGLTEAGRASSESRMYRRRIEAARRILDGIDDVSG